MRVVPLSPSENPLYFACANGNLEMLIWLMQLWPDAAQGESANRAFAAACGRGHMNVAQWLLATRPRIDLGHDDHLAFRTACENNHGDVARWLADTWNERQRRAARRRGADREGGGEAGGEGGGEAGGEGEEDGTWYDVVDHHGDVLNYSVQRALSPEGTVAVSAKPDACPICYEAPEDVQTQCGHRFCLACIRNHRRQSDTCPICRRAVQCVLKCVFTPPPPSEDA